MIFPYKELYPQFVLQLHKLPGKGRLSNVKQGRRLRDILLPGSHQKILQHANFHAVILHI